MRPGEDGVGRTVRSVASVDTAHPDIRSAETGGISRKVIWLML